MFYSSVRIITNFDTSLPTLEIIYLFQFILYFLNLELAKC